MNGAPFRRTRGVTTTTAFAAAFRGVVRGYLTNQLTIV